MFVTFSAIPCIMMFRVFSFIDGLYVDFGLSSNIHMKTLVN